MLIACYSIVPSDINEEMASLVEENGIRIWGNEVSFGPDWGLGGTG